MWRPMDRDRRGCLRCRTRKKRCDYGRPRCGFCAEFDFGCIWEEDVPEGDARSIVRAFMEQGVVTSIQASFRPSERPSLVEISPNMPASQITSDLCIAFLIDEYFKGQNEETSLASSKAWTIQALAKYIDQNTPMSMHCLEACAYAAFSKGYDRSDIASIGARSYDACIIQVYESLKDPNLRLKPETLISLALLVLYEFIKSSDIDAWSKHCGSLRDLIASMKPETLSKLPEKLVLGNCRLPIILQALLRRERTFLTEKRWKLLPWWHSPRWKLGLKHLLIDILTDLPGLLEESDGLQSELENSGAQTQNSQQLSKLVDGSVVLLQQLDEWKQIWETQKPNARCEDAGPKDPHNPRPTTIRPIKFDSFDSASEILYYNMAVIIACQISTSIQRLNKASNRLPPLRTPTRVVQDNPLNLTALLKTDFNEKAFGAAREICRCAEYATSWNLFGRGARMHARPPIYYALQEIGSFPEGRWLQTIYDTIRD